MKKRKLSNEEISGLCQELSILIHSGVATGDGLSLLAEEETSEVRRELLFAMAKDVDGGASLAEAVKKTDAFPDYVCGLLEVGERAGRTEEALSALSRSYEDRVRLDRQVRSALLYPAILLVIMLAVIVILLVQVLPVFNDVYAYLGGSLTGVAGGLLAFGQMLDTAMPVLCVLLGIVVVFLAVFAASMTFRDKVMTLWCRVMGDRGVSRQINTARFAQSLALGLKSGLPIEEALTLASSLLESVPSAKARCDECIKKLEGGATLSAAMRDSGVLPRTECHLLEIGMKSGAGDTAIEQIARRLSEESEIALEEKVSRVEPALVMVTSVLVGVILLSVMLPLMNIMTAIG